MSVRSDRSSSVGTGRVGLEDGPWSRPVAAEPEGRECLEVREARIEARFERRRDPSLSNSRALDKVARRRLHPSWEVFLKTMEQASAIPREERVAFAGRVEAALKRLHECAGRFPEGAGHGAHATFSPADDPSGTVVASLHAMPLEVMPDDAARRAVAALYGNGFFRMALRQEDVPHVGLEMDWSTRSSGTPQLGVRFVMRMQGVVWESAIDEDGIRHRLHVPGMDADEDADGMENHVEAIARAARSRANLACGLFKVRRGVCFNPLLWGFNVRPDVPRAGTNDPRADRWLRVAYEAG